MARTTGPAGKSVASKLFEILDCFAPNGPALSLTDIARRTNLPTSTVRRLLAELVAWGGLEQVPGKGYRIGMRLWEVGACAVEQRALREAAAPYMQDLYEVTQQNIQLVVLDDFSGLCVARVYGRRAMRTEVDVGGRMPLHSTAAGKALLAFAPSNVFERAAASGLEVYTGRTISSPDRLASALRQIRASRLAYSREEHKVGSQAVASPIFGPGPRVVGSVGVVGPVKVNLDHLGPAVRTMATAISRAMAM